MIKIEYIKVSKTKVYNDVAMTTAYVGAKMPSAEGDDAYLRISTSDDDRLMLERFWGDACNLANGLFRPFLLTSTPQPIGDGVDLDCDYEVQLRMPEGYDATLTPTIESTLHTVFVDVITAKWFRIANKEEAQAYDAEAASLMDSIRRNLYHRMKPVREMFDLVN